jgi:hydroxymethylbilane synthase
MHVRIGTRGSRLARWQAEWVAEELRRRKVEVELVPLATEGDRKDQGALAQLGAIGIFTREIQRAVLENRVDLAVHSLKDLPTAPTPGIHLAAVPLRGPCEDVLVTREKRVLVDLPRQSRIGTGSLRRGSQILYLRDDLQIVPIRGNVETRLQKLESGEYDGIVLARAGLLRLGLEQYVHQIFETHEMIPAVGQAALGLEIRTEDIELQTCLNQIDHRPTHQAVLAERTLLNDLRGGCLAPIGGWAREVEKHCLQLDAVVLDPQGKKRLFQSQSGPLGEAQTIGKEVAEKLLADGAAALINAAREPNIP